MTRAYDQFGHRFALPLALAAVPISGTASALAAIATAEVPIPFNCKLIAGVRRNTTGATAAVALTSCVIVKSVGGTGTVSAVGTFVWNGTCATGATGSAATLATGTSAEFVHGDIAAISLAIGTIAAISTHSFVLGFEEMYA